MQKLTVACRQLWLKVHGAKEIFLTKLKTADSSRKNNALDFTITRGLAATST